MWCPRRVVHMAFLFADFKTTLAVPRKPRTVGRMNLNAEVPDAAPPPKVITHKAFRVCFNIF